MEFEIGILFLLLHLCIWGLIMIFKALNGIQFIHNHHDFYLNNLLVHLNCFHQ